MDTYREVGKDSTPRAAPRAPDFVPIQGPRHGSLHLRLALLVAGAILPVLLLAGYLIYSAYVRTRDDGADRITQIAQSAIAAVNRELENQIAALQILALEPALVEGNFADFRDDAERFVQVGEGYVIGVSDAAGNQVFNTEVRDNLKPWTNQDAFYEVLKTKRPAVSDMYVGGVTGRPTFTVNVPVIRDGEVAYVVGYSPARENYYEILERLALPTGWIVNIYDRQGRHVARIPRLPDEQLRQIGENARRQFAAQNTGIIPTTSIEGSPMLAAFARSTENGWTVAIGMPQETLEKPLRDSLLLTIAIGATLLLIGVVFSSRLASQIVRAESQRSLLMNELNHRVKNTLSSVQGIVARGLPDLPANVAYRKAAESRLMALSGAHNILSRANWESADLGDLAKTVVLPYGPRDRIRLDGPDVILPPRVAVPLAMILNELATNAAKYGALSNATGILHVTWALLAADKLRLEWHEAGGPVIAPPSALGYGTRFIERAVSAELKGTYTAFYPAEGFTCAIEIPV